MPPATPLDLERTRELLRPIVEHWARHGPLMRAMRDAAVYDSTIDGLVAGAQERFHEMVVAALEAPARRGSAAGRRPPGARPSAGVDERSATCCWPSAAARRPMSSRRSSTLALGWNAILGAP